MKKLLVLILVMSSSVFAGDELLSNQDCIDIYRTGYINLTHYIERFNDGAYNRFEMAGAVNTNSAVIGGVRLACQAVENPSVENCVKAYKDLYKSLREKVKVGAILMGNQRAVTYSTRMQSVVEEVSREGQSETALGRIFTSLRVGLGVISETVSRSKDITLLEYIDMKCNN